MLKLCGRDRLWVTHTGEEERSGVDTFRSAAELAATKVVELGSQNTYDVTKPSVSEGTSAMRSGTTPRDAKTMRDRLAAALGSRRRNPEPAGGVPLQRGGSLLDWHEVAPQHYVGDGYEIALIEPYKWEIRHQGDHVEFDDSREYSFEIVENHHREMLRTQDLETYGGVAVASVIGLVILLTLTPGSPVWLLALGALWVVHSYAALSFIFTLARIGHLRCGARYARPFGKATHRALKLDLRNSP